MASILGVALAGQAAGIRLNHTASMPIGVWQAHKVDPGRVYATADIVEVCPPLTQWEQVYLAPGNCPSGREPMLKPVVAVAGDNVEINGHGVVVNGKSILNSSPLSHDGSGRTLQPYAAGSYRVQFGEVWLVVPRADSLDSRYLGPVPIAAIRALATPIWIWR